jgi:type II secretory pathway component PulC
MILYEIYITNYLERLLSYNKGLINLLKLQSHLINSLHKNLNLNVIIHLLKFISKFWTIYYYNKKVRSDSLYIICKS